MYSASPLTNGLVGNVNLEPATESGKGESEQNRRSDKQGQIGPENLLWPKHTESEQPFNGPFHVCIGLGAEERQYHDNGNPKCSRSLFSDTKRTPFGTAEKGHLCFCYLTILSPKKLVNSRRGGGGGGGRGHGGNMSVLGCQQSPSK